MKETLQVLPDKMHRYDQPPRPNHQLLKQTHRKNTFKVHYRSEVKKSCKDLPLGSCTS